MISRKIVNGDHLTFIEAERVFLDLRRLKTNEDGDIPDWAAEMMVLLGVDFPTHSGLLILALEAVSESFYVGLFSS